MADPAPGYHFAICKASRVREVIVVEVVAGDEPFVSMFGDWERHEFGEFEWLGAVALPALPG